MSDPVATCCGMLDPLYVAEKLLHDTTTGPLVDATTVRQITLWLLDGDCGDSSKTIARTALGMPSRGEHPHDHADFGRCLALLERAPGARVALEALAQRSRTWATLAREWDELTAAYEQMIRTTSTRLERWESELNQRLIAGTR